MTILLKAVALAVEMTASAIPLSVAVIPPWAVVENV